MTATRLFGNQSSVHYVRDALCGRQHTSGDKPNEALLENDPTVRPHRAHDSGGLILPFSNWGGVSGDQAAAAMIDRIVQHADVLTLKGASTGSATAASTPSPASELAAIAVTKLTVFAIKGEPRRAVSAN